MLYKRGGFTPEEIAKLREHTRSMSFDEIYYPGIPYDPSRIDKVLEDYHKQIFTQEGDNPAADEAEPPPGSDEPGRVATDNPSADEGPVLPATTLGALAWQHADLRRLRGYRRRATCSTSARSPTTGRTSPPT